MQAFTSATKLIVPARQAMKYRSFADSTNPASKDMSKQHFAGERVTSGSSSNKSENPFSIKEDLHAKGLDQQSKEAMMNSVFPKSTSTSSTDGLQFTNKEKKMYEHPVQSGIDKLAEGVESRGAQASENYTASKKATNTAANFANGADNVARTGDKVRQSVQGAHDKMSEVGKKIGDMSHAPSIGNDPSSDVKTTTANMGMGENETRDKSSTSSSNTSKIQSAMSSGMEKMTEKMSGFGATIADKMKPLEGLADSMSTPHMPKSVENLKDTIKSATESVKQAMPHSIDEAKDVIAKKMPSMDSIKSTVNSVKDSMPSMPKAVTDAKESVSKSMPSMNDAKDAAKSAASTAANSMPSMNNAKNTAAHTMEEGKDTLKRSADYVKDKAVDAKDAAVGAMSGVTAAGVVDQFKQGMQTMKEAMKPIVDYSTDKIKTGASMAAEKIPPMAESLKEKASNVMHSQTVESIKETVTHAAKGTYEKAKDVASSVTTGKSEAQKMNIVEDTLKVNKSKLQAKDQEMSSSDIYKP